MTPGNPIAQMMARSIVDKLASRGASPSPGGAPSGAAPDAMQGSLESKMGDLSAADPQGVVKALEKMKQDVVGLIPKTAFRIPALTKHLLPLMKALDGAIKEAQQAQSTQQTVSSMPIGLSMANQQSQPEAGGGLIPGGM